MMNTSRMIRRQSAQFASRSFEQDDPAHGRLGRLMKRVRHWLLRTRRWRGI